ncbi:MAG: hypothetical protein WD648_04650 [Planctomycetaceae bacterium]
MRTPTLQQSVGLTLICAILLPALVVAQDKQAQPEANKSAPPQIADEPKTIDPALHVPPKLAAKVTVNFANSSLNEIAQWIAEQQKIPVMFDNKALAAEGIPLGEPVTDHLNNEPLYLLLNRLSSLGLAWYVDEEILHITTIKVANEKATTRSYILGDLLDAGYKRDLLVDTIIEATLQPWESKDGEGAADPEWLGDVLFVRQNDRAHYEIAGLLAALRKHGRQTFTFDPPQHIGLREKLEKNVSLNFRDTPLVTAIDELARQAGADIRLEASMLRSAKVREREPVSLTLTDRKLSTALQALLTNLNLTWVLRDGVLWITTMEEASKNSKTAVYDVRDLCRNESESNELQEAIENQTGGPWESHQGEGGQITFAKDGTMIIIQTESAHREVVDLLANYRKALLASKRRDRDVIDPKEVITRYYRMDAAIAADLIGLLPQLVQPETWKSDKNPGAPGTIMKAASESDVVTANDLTASSGTNVGAAAKNSVIVPRAVLIVRQTRTAHDDIAKTIDRVRQGDPRGPDQVAKPGRGVGGGTGGGGGFGGGFFNRK